MGHPKIAIEWRERERERDRQTDRQTDRQRQRQRERESIKVIKISETK